MMRCEALFLLFNSLAVWRRILDIVAPGDLLDVTKKWLPAWLALLGMRGQAKLMMCGRDAGVNVHAHIVGRAKPHGARCAESL
jgi:hypothetical protein